MIVADEKDKSTASVSGDKAVLTSTLSAPGKAPVTQRAEMELLKGTSAWAKNMYVLGPVGTILVAFITSMFFFMYSFRQELHDAREEAARERKEMVDRYIAEQETRNKRFQEVVGKIDKVVLWVDRLADWMFKERAGKLPPAGERPPTPKIKDEEK